MTHICYIQSHITNMVNKCCVNKLCNSLSWYRLLYLGEKIIHSLRAHLVTELCYYIYPNIVIQALWKQSIPLLLLYTQAWYWIPQDLLGLLVASLINWMGGDFFSVIVRWWPLSTMWRVLKSIHGHHRGCLNNPIFSNLGLCASCWARFMCYHTLWPSSVSHPFSSFNSSLGFAGGQHYQKVIILIVF